MPAPRASAPGRETRLSALWRARRRVRRVRLNIGWCAVCSATAGQPRRTVFVEIGPWSRDDYLCTRCLSIPRERALLQVLEEEVPNWRRLRVHESSPSGRGASRALRTACPGYDSSQYLPDVAPGEVVGGVRSENLESMTFGDESLDLLVTQDVMEHVLDPVRALGETARVLRPGGAHVATFPWYPWLRQSRPRARRDADGQVRQLEPDTYHANPVGDGRALVTTDWGADVFDIVAEAGLACEVRHVMQDRRHGLDGEFLNVFVLRKAGNSAGQVAGPPQARTTLG